MKTPNGWKPATVTKLANTPRSAIVTSDGTLYRRNRREMIKTSQVGRNPCTQTPQGDKEAWGTEMPPRHRTPLHVERDLAELSDQPDKRTLYIISGLDLD